MPVRHSERSLIPLISTRSAMPSIEKSASWRWTWIFASGYTSSWEYLYPKGTDISNERGCRQGREASPVSEQSPPEQTAWNSQKHILLQAQGRTSGWIWRSRYGQPSCRGPRPNMTGIRREARYLERWAIC